MANTVAELLTYSQSQLDDLFRSVPAGPIPNGEAKGTAIVAPGTALSPEIAKLVKVFAWKGKVFDAAEGVLRNKVTLLGLRAIVAKVYKGPSWLDQKECIILDYSETSLIAGWIRDEIRMIAPGIYLGKVYGHSRRLIDFALEFPQAAAPASSV